jgi:HAD superfamily hydrolase (TIGR01509 family)
MRGKVVAMSGRHDAAMIFDLDGTLADSVYQHVSAWDTSLRTNGIELSVWRIHRRIGMSGGLFVRALGRELGHDLTPELVATLQLGHSQAYEKLVDSVRPLPGARELLATLTDQGVPWAIATSGSRDVATRTLRILDVPDHVPVVTRTDVTHAKPNPDLFLEAARRLAVEPGRAFVVGDSIWDLLAAQRAGSLGIGVLSGGYGDDELQRAGAYRVYADPADLLQHLDELGIRISV